MPKIAHLILAHRSPDQLSQLVNALAYPSHRVYVHVDKKVDIIPFKHQLDAAATTFITRRKRIDWGAYSVVEATLSAMSEIIDNGQYDFINLLSGADYPLVKPGVVDYFLNDHLQKSFMEFQHQGTPWWEHTKGRTEKVHLTDYRFRGKHRLQQIINVFPFKRTPPMGLELVGRSQWFTITARHAAYILHYVEKNPVVVNFFKHTWGPDEFFFQTILFNSQFRDEIINDNLRYIDWSEGAASPKTLTRENYPELASSGKFYARKFDIALDSTILSMLDEFRTCTQ